MKYLKLVKIYLEGSKKIKFRSKKLGKICKISKKFLKEF